MESFSVYFCSRNEHLLRIEYKLILKFKPLYNAHAAVHVLFPRLLTNNAIKTKRTQQESPSKLSNIECFRSLFKSILFDYIFPLSKLHFITENGSIWLCCLARPWSEIRYSKRVSWYFIPNLFMSLFQPPMKPIQSNRILYADNIKYVAVKRFWIFSIMLKIQKAIRMNVVDCWWQIYV